MFFAWLRRLFGGKKKSEDQLIVDYGLKDLKKGYLLDYDLQTWEILEEYKYKYGSRYTKEYKIRSAEQTLYLNVMDTDQLLLSVCSSININKVNANLRTAVLKENLPANFAYNGQSYYLSEELDGYFTEVKENDWAGFSGWEYINEEETQFISISYWEDGSIEAFIGDFIKERDVTNILPHS
jgi:hypothetical protein